MHSYLIYVKWFMLFTDKVVNYYQDEAMWHDKTSGVIVTNHSLVLQKISRQRSGIYVCEATNRVGRGRSQAIALDVKCKFSLQ